MSYRIIKKTGLEDKSVQYIIQKKFLFLFWITAKYYVLRTDWYNNDYIDLEKCIFMTEEHATKIIKLIKSDQIKYKGEYFIHVLDERVPFNNTILWINSNDLESSTDLDFLKRRVDIRKQKYKKQIVWNK